MATFREYSHLDGLGLADLIRKGEVTATDVLDSALERIDRLNPRVNAVVHRLDDFGRGMIASGLGEGAFHGVPLLVKDLDGEVAGTPYQAGSASLLGNVSREDSEIARRWRASGAVICGKTNCPEFGISGVTEPVAYGTARNPWAPDRTAGGSSGGSGIAVAMRMVPIATGGDGGGSLRIPASCNGVFGLKPTRGRTPDGPQLTLPWQGFATRHALTVSVRDSAAFLDATRGPEIGSPFVAPNPTGMYLQDVTTEPGRLRVALTTVPLTGGTVHPDCVDAAHDAATLMRSLGHEVEIAAPRIDAIAFNRAFLTVVATEVAALVRQLGALTGRAFTWRDVETETWALYLAGSQIRAHELVQAQQTLWKVCRELGEFFTKHDVLLTPTLTTPPPPHGAIGPQGFEQILLRALVRTNAGLVMRLVKALERNAETVFHFVSSLTPFNVSGQPAMSVPLYWNHAGLPIGVQIAGRFGDESTLFRLAGQLERARPWANRIPPGCEAV